MSWIHGLLFPVYFKHIWIWLYPPPQDLVEVSRPGSYKIMLRCLVCTYWDGNSFTHLKLFGRSNYCSEFVCTCYDIATRFWKVFIYIIHQLEIIFIITDTLYWSWAMCTSQSNVCLHTACLQFMLNFFNNLAATHCHWSIIKRYI
jgi:hypothetical protein